MCVSQTVVELNHRSIGVAHRVIIVDDQGLQMLDQAALQITTARGLDGRIDQSFATSHAVEENKTTKHSEQTSFLASKAARDTHVASLRTDQ